MSGDDKEQEGSRRPIILGYEKVADIDKRLAQLDTKLEAALEGQQEQSARSAHQYSDHEARIRSLELTMAGIVASGSTSKQQWLWVWAAIMTVGQLAVAILNYMK